MSDQFIRQLEDHIGRGSHSFASTAFLKLHVLQYLFNGGLYDVHVLDLLPRPVVDSVCQKLISEPRIMALAFHSWSVFKIQRCWRYRRHALQLKHIQRNIACRRILRWWRLCRQRRVRMSPTVAAQRIQNCWRSHYQRRIFRYLVHVLQQRERMDPWALLKLIHAPDAPCFDSSCQLYVRLRFGISPVQLATSPGTTLAAYAPFPPAIFYKIFTTTPVVDVNAFAPRPNYQHEQIRTAEYRAKSHQNAEHLLGSRPLSVLSHEELQQCYIRTDRNTNNGWRMIQHLSSSVFTQMCWLRTRLQATQQLPITQSVVVARVAAFLDDFSVSSGSSGAQLLSW